MRKILLFGAGRSSSSLIRYLAEQAPAMRWVVRIGDRDLETAQAKASMHPYCEAFQFNADNLHQRILEVGMADIVISMLPPHLHTEIAESCVELSKPLVTASYRSREILELDAKAQQKGMLLLSEIGVDPGIDHLSAMAIIDSIKNKGGTVQRFISDTGGLIAPEYDTNPWNYKFTWNPRNVVLAGNKGARFLDHGRIKHLPYHRVFQHTHPLSFPHVGEFESYPNRDSLNYIEEYQLQNIQTLIRGTIRGKGFCKAWNLLVQLGMTDSTYTLEKANKKSWRELTNTFLPYCKNKVENKLANLLKISIESDEFRKLNWLGLLDETPIDIDSGTPADILLHLLLKKWKLETNDIDMIVMKHQFLAQFEEYQEEIESNLVFFGEDKTHTAMSLTVGLPVGIATKLILNGQIKLTGSLIPLHPNIYKPILNELKNYGIEFKETIKPV